MGKYLARGLMFISSYFPLYIFLLILQFKVYKNIDFSLTFKDSYMIIFFLSMIIFIGISFISMCLLYKSTGNKKFKIKDVKRSNDSVISYIFTYILPILSFSLDDFAISLVNFLIFVLVGFLYIKLDLMYLNPLWTLQGYTSYEMDNKYIITDISYNDLKRNNNEELMGYSLTNGIIVIKEKDNLTQLEYKN